MRATFTLVFLWGSLVLGWGQTTTIDFETAGDGYTPSTTFGSGDIDVFNRSNPIIGGNSTFIWACEDMSVTNPSITLDQIDITGATSFDFSIDFLTPNTEDWDTSDELLITYSVDGGSPQNLIWVQSIPDGDAFNAPAALDLGFDGDGDVGQELPALTDDAAAGVGSNFQTFSTSSISLSGNSTLDITLQFNSLTSTDEGIYIDNITITQSSTGGGCGITSLGTATYNCATNTTGADNDNVTVEIPYTGSDANASLSIMVNGSTATNTGDDPTSTADGTIAFAASEGDSWEVSIFGGTCNLFNNGSVPSAECDPVPNIVINELMPDPDSDVNGDGTLNFVDDEFVELYNNGFVVTDISGWTINDNVGVRHTFPIGTTLNPGKGMVIFGGGTPTGIPTSTQTASTGMLGINNSGDNIQLFDGASNLVDSYSFSGSSNDVSYGRSPDFTGSFIAHTSIDMTNYSPGEQNVSGAPLPITLHSFTATPQGSQALLHWRTATELNNDYMAVEHSTDGRRYEEIGRVMGAGTTQQAQDYQFTHGAPAAGLNYYRLRQVDYDGQYEYHGPVSVRFGDAGGLLQVFPTAVREELTVRYSNQLQPGANVQVLSLDGQLRRSLRWDAKNGRQMQLDVSGLSAGLYLLRLQNGRELSSARFVKQ